MITLGYIMVIGGSIMLFILLLILIWVLVSVLKSGVDEGYLISLKKNKESEE